MLMLRTNLWVETALKERPMEESNEYRCRQ
jgi:hypothetical protein